MFNALAKYENRRQDIAQGTGSRELQQKRLQYYNEHAKEHNGFWGGRKAWARDVVSKMTEAELDRELSRSRGGSAMNGITPTKTVQGKSPIGINPAFRMPGYGLLTGPSHFKGGIKGMNRGQLWEAEGGEFLINKQSSAKYRNELVKIQNGTYNPYSYSNDLIKNDMRRHYGAMEVANRGVASNQMLTQNQPNQVSGTIKVDIPQTITINIAGQGKIGDYDISGIIRNYVDAFMKEAEMRKSFSGFNKEKFYNQAGVVSAFGR